MTGKDLVISLRRVGAYKVYGQKQILCFLDHNYRGDIKRILNKKKVKYSVDFTEKQKIGHKGNGLVTDLGLFLVLFASPVEMWRPAIGSLFNFFFKSAKN